MYKKMDMVVSSANNKQSRQAVYQKVNIVGGLQLVSSSMSRAGVAGDERPVPLGVQPQPPANQPDGLKGQLMQPCLCMAVCAWVHLKQACAHLPNVLLQTYSIQNALCTLTVWKGIWSGDQFDLIVYHSS